MITKQFTSSLFSLRFRSLSVRLRFSTCARYVMPAYNKVRYWKHKRTSGTYSKVVALEVQRSQGTQARQ
jgi:hypothetical protein